MKKLCFSVLILVLVFTTTVFGEISNNDVNFLLEKICTTENEAVRINGVHILSTYLDKETPNVQGLTDFIETSSDLKEMIEDKGYKVSDVVDSLDIFYKVPQSDIKKVINAVENRDEEGLAKVVNKYTEDNQDDEDEDDNNNAPSGGGSGKDDKEEDKEVVNVVEEEEVQLVEVKFEDISEHWAKENIKFLAEKNIIDGYTPEVYDPEKEVSNAEFTKLITVLFKLDKVDDKVVELDDVKAEDWFYNFVKIATDNDIVHLGDKQYTPNAPIVREQMIYMAIACLEKLETVEIKDSSDVSMFSDNEQISEWAKAACSKAYNLGIIKGRENNQLAPKASLTRAEAATIIRSLYDLINK